MDRKLIQLRRKLQKQLGIIDYNFTRDELQEFISEIRQIPVEKWELSQLQKIVTEITGVKQFLILESLDTSDLDYLIDQINDSLKNNG